jgi:hypothetical protein
MKPSGGSSLSLFSILLNRHLVILLPCRTQLTGFQSGPIFPWSGSCITLFGIVPYQILCTVSWVLREATESICPFHPFFHFWLLHVSRVNSGSMMVGSCMLSSPFPFMFCLILWQGTRLFCTRQISHLR